MLFGGSQGGLEIRDNGGTTSLVGRFPYEATTVLWDGGSTGQARKERIASRAFASRIGQSGQDIHLLVAHDIDQPLASRSAGSLTLADTDAALEFEARIAPELKAAPYVQNFMAGLAAGLITGISPGFRVRHTPGAETVSADGKDLLRTVRSADLFEISAVTVPAYPQAQIEARSWQSAQSSTVQNIHHMRRWR